MIIGLKIALLWFMTMLASWIYAKVNRSKSSYNDKYYYKEGDGVWFDFMRIVTIFCIVAGLIGLFVFWLFNGFDK